MDILSRKLLHGGSELGFVDDCNDYRHPASLEYLKKKINHF